MYAYDMWCLTHESKCICITSSTQVHTCSYYFHIIDFLFVHMIVIVALDSPTLQKSTFTFIWRTSLHRMNLSFVSIMCVLYYLVLIESIVRIVYSLYCEILLIMYFTIQDSLFA